jgi:hypothetical protein
MLTGVAISGDRNMIKKEAEKILHCKDVKIKFQDTWNVKSKVISVITGQLEPSQNHQENI